MFGTLTEKPGVYILPDTLGATVKATARALAERGEQTTPDTLLYMEKAGGFQCRLCEFARPTNATHGRCLIMQGPIHLDEGCCAAWLPNLAQLQLFREKG
ncbi:MAG TPA: hypothetical protein VI542_24590 [Candidatus Tectomicrobia bacterium]